MTKGVDFYYDFGSPATYLAYTQMDEIAQSSGATVNWRPILLGGVFKATGNSSPMMVPAKGAWMFKDLERTASKFGVEFAISPQFPYNTLALMRAATAYRDAPNARAVIDAGFRAVWTAHHDIAQEAGMRAFAADAGVPYEELSARIADPAVKDRLREETDAAIARGVFGLPAFFVGETMIFGQDRLDWLREALAA